MLVKFSLFDSGSNPFLIIDYNEIYKQIFPTRKCPEYWKSGRMRMPTHTVRGGNHSLMDTVGEVIIYVRYQNGPILPVWALVIRGLGDSKVLVGDGLMQCLGFKILDPFGFDVMKISEEEGDLGMEDCKIPPPPVVDVQQFDGVHCSGNGGGENAYCCNVIIDLKTRE